MAPERPETARPQPAPAEGPLLQWRCWNCGRVLSHYQPPIGLVRVICQRCNACNVLTTDEAA